jgi:hypothetical protein
MIDYEPGESTSGLFGGNSNWRGPVWMPVNYTLIQSLEKFHRFLGNGYKVPVPCEANREMTLKQIADLIAARLTGLFRAIPMDIFRHFRGTARFSTTTTGRT